MAGKSSSPQNGNTSTFSVRTRKSDYDLLEQIANLYGITVAELARRYLIEGIERDLVPDKIEALMEDRKEKLLTAARAVRAAEAP